MRIDEANHSHLIADEGKVLRRISDNWISGMEVYLGYTYRIGTEELPEAYLEQPEDFEEIDNPNEAEIVLLDEEIALFDIPTTSITIIEEQLEIPIEDPAKHVVTVSDYRELERKVELLMRLIGEK